jgi:hypothetical protein
MQTSRPTRFEHQAMAHASNALPPKLKGSWILGGRPPLGTVSVALDGQHHRREPSVSQRQSEPQKQQGGCDAKPLRVDPRPVQARPDVLPRNQKALPDVAVDVLMDTVALVHRVPELKEP